jgi:hypothetical protein
MRRFTGLRLGVCRGNSLNPVGLPMISQND